MTTNKLASEPFFTIQGEGQLLGHPMSFIRMAGCSVGCKSCDTDYKYRLAMSTEAIVEAVRSMHPHEYTWITGGEPTDHDLSDLITQLRKSGQKIALATSGIRPAPRVDFLSVSPHGEFVQRMGSEIKVVPLLNGLDVWRLDLKNIQFPYKYLMPMHGSQESLDICLDVMSKNPSWKLTVQAHKVWGVK